MAWRIVVNNTYETIEMETAKDALDEILRLNKALSDGDVSTALHASLLKGIMEFTRVYELTVLEDRVLALEKARG